jgi:hypothetical protein
MGLGGPLELCGSRGVDGAGQLCRAEPGQSPIVFGSSVDDTQHNLHLFCTNSQISSKDCRDVEDNADAVTDSVRD